MEKLECPICGETTRVYMGNARKDKLCGKHADLLKAEEIYLNEEGVFLDKKTNRVLNKNYLYTDLPSEGFSSCIICNEETDGYAFCKKCYKKHALEELLELLNGTANLTITESKQQEFDKNEAAGTIIINENNKSKCITCGRDTGGLLFCSSCFYKYKDKELVLRITNCSNVELLDADYEGRYTCKDGHVVKSKSERDIDNYLFEKGISHAYEKELPYGSEEKDTLHPDFYLPNYLGKDKHVYIEHWGYNENNIQYTKTKKFKMPIYKNLEITLVCTYEKTDTGKIDSVLDRKLNKDFIKENKINFED